jgi:hypothetical protein
MEVPLHDVEVGVWCAVNVRSIMGPVFCVGIINSISASRPVTCTLFTVTTADQVGKACMPQHSHQIFFLYYMKWTGHGRGQNCIKNLSLKFRRERPLERFSCRWENNIKMDVKEIWHDEVDWIYVAQDRGQWWALVNMVLNLSVL